MWLGWGFDNKSFTLDTVLSDDLRKKNVSAAVLMGIISVSQYKTFNDKIYASSQEREEISDQVVSRVLPVMKWIKKHIEKDHYCIPKDD